MNRRYEKIYSPALGRDMEILAFGHYGAPLIAFPSGGGTYFDFESNGMISAIQHLIEGGKIKVYCPPSMDRESWLNKSLNAHHKALIHNAYQNFIVSNLVPAIRTDCHDPRIRIALTGCSLGAYHAANHALKFPHIFHYALCMSGLYDMGRIAGSSHSPDVYFNNPLAFVPNLEGNDLEHVRHNTHVALVCGQGAYEENNLKETHRLADCLAAKQISHERDIWGHDVEHHWFWWRKQIVYHLEKTFT